MRWEVSMNLKDKLNSIFSKLRGLFGASIIIVGMLVGTTSVQASTIESQPMSQSRNSSVLDTLNLDRDPKVDYNPGYLTTWLDSLRQSNKNCQFYMNTWDWFTSCEPAASQADVNEEKSPFNNLNEDQSS